MELVPPSEFCEYQELCISINKIVFYCIELYEHLHISTTKNVCFFSPRGNNNAVCKIYFNLKCLDDAFGIQAIKNSCSVV